MAGLRPMRVDCAAILTDKAPTLDHRAWVSRVLAIVVDRIALDDMPLLVCTHCIAPDDFRVDDDSVWGGVLTSDIAFLLNCCKA